VAYILRKYPEMKLRAALDKESLGTLGGVGICKPPSSVSKVLEVANTASTGMPESELLELIRGIPHGSQEKDVESWLTEEEAVMVRRFDPSGMHNGFFVAAFEKSKEGC